MSNPVKRLDALIEDLNEIQRDYINFRKIRNKKEFMASTHKKIKIRNYKVYEDYFYAVIIYLLTIILWIVFIVVDHISIKGILGVFVLGMTILSLIALKTTYDTYMEDKTHFVSNKYDKLYRALNAKIEKHRDILNKLPFNIFEDRYDVRKIVLFMKNLNLTLDQAIENYDNLCQKYLPVYKEELRLDANRKMLKEKKNMNYIDLWKEESYER